MCLLSIPASDLDSSCEDSSGGEGEEGEEGEGNMDTEAGLYIKRLMFVCVCVCVCVCTCTCCIFKLSGTIRSLVTMAETSNKSQVMIIGIIGIGIA